MLQAVSDHLVFTQTPPPVSVPLAASAALFSADPRAFLRSRACSCWRHGPHSSGCFSSFLLCVFSVKTKWALLLVSSKNDVFTVCAGKQSDAG